VLWVHFFWSGALTMGFALAAWQEIRGHEAHMPNAGGNDQRRNMASQKMLSGPRKRILRISITAAASLLLNLGVNIFTSAALENFVTSSAMWLDCSVFETWKTKNWDAYSFADGSVCSLHKLVFYL
jgi:hypothetical protein